MSRQLDGRVAVVTGAGRGIGRATAVALAREGADVACVARTASQLAETAALVRAAGRRAQHIEADIGEPGAPSLIAAKVLAELGAVGIPVNNAATAEPAGPTATAGPEDWARAVAVNLTGPVRLTLAFAPELAGLLRDRQERVPCRLTGQILQFRAGNLDPRPAPSSLTTGGPQQHRVQLRQRRFSSRAIIGKRLQPSG
jgi:NAD(P)-dependent dehydrogenase (short-subunit alcohol dehydrogenase family)